MNKLKKAIKTKHGLKTTTLVLAVEKGGNKALLSALQSPTPTNTSTSNSSSTIDDSA